MVVIIVYLCKAEWIQRLPTNLKVVGSIPGRVHNLIILVETNKSAPKYTQVSQIIF